MDEQINDLNIDRIQSISLPSSRYERRIALRLLDWNRCKRKLNSIKKPSQWIRDISLWLVGISATTAFSLLTMFNEENPNLFFRALYTTTFYFSILGAAVFYFLDRRYRKEMKDDVDELLFDMNEIEQTFTRTENVPPEGA